MLRNLSLALVLTTAVALPVYAIADEDHGHWYRDHGDYRGYYHAYRGYPGYGYREWSEHGPFGEHPYERFHEWQEHGGFGEDNDD